MDGPFRIRYEALSAPRSFAERFAAMDDLFETAIAMRKARFLRDHPGVSDAEARHAVEEWILAPRDDYDPIFVPITGARLRAILERSARR